jgi:4'-phosphopantetheinyl transferase
VTRWHKPPRTLRLAEREVHVWRSSLDLAPECLGVLWQTLAEDDRQRAGRFHFPKDRNHFVAARGRLRVLLGRYAGLPPEDAQFRYGPRGKPYLAGDVTGLQFNAAHSHGLALYAFTRGSEIGVDLEYFRSRVSDEKIAERFFSPEEVAALRSLPPSQQREAFFNCWTRKEAFLKAKGEGVAFGLGQFTVSLAPGEPAALLATPFDPPEATRWSLFEVDPGPRYAGAVAVPRSVGRLLCWQCPEE